MSRYTGPSWKQSRRLGLSLTGTGKELARRNYVPGQHGKSCSVAVVADFPQTPTRVQPVH